MSLKKKELRPVPSRPEYSERIESVLTDFFVREFYLPLMKETNGVLYPREVLNSKSEDAILKAISRGRIRYGDGVFTGKFGSSISRELYRMGARWDRRVQGFRIPRSKLLPEHRAAISLAEERVREAATKIVDKLGKMSPATIAKKINLDKSIQAISGAVESDFQKSVSAMRIEAKFTPEEKRIIADKYTLNMEKYIQEWTEKEIVSLRKKMQRHTLIGARYEEMVATIQKSYGVSRNKAKFLARQETNLLVSEIRQTRFKSAGVNKYKWRTVRGSPDHPVRAMHKALDGKTFSWDNPPITSEDGRKNHPGEDFNCRCIAVPVVEL